MMDRLKTKRVLLIIVSIFCLFYLNLSALDEGLNTNTTAQEKLQNASETKQKSITSTYLYLEDIKDIAYRIFKTYANLLKDRLAVQNTTQSINIKETNFEQEQKYVNNVVYIQETPQINNNILLNFEALFKSDSTKVLASNLAKVTIFAKFLKDNPQFDIKIVGHASNTSSSKILTKKQTAEYNINLSLKRANTIKEILIKNGVDASKIITEGKGFSQPIASNKTIEGQKKNRRIEVILINKSAGNKSLVAQENINQNKNKTNNDKLNNVVYIQETPQINNNILLNFEALFKSDSTKVLASNLAKVTIFAKFLKDNPQFDIKIVGHASNTSSSKILTKKQTAEYNINLSLKRANTIKEILIKNGVDASKIITEGKGFSQPIASNKTIEGQKKNRRIEAILINKSAGNKSLVAK